MICPQCGYDMGNKNKCIRCGYTVKNLAVVDSHSQSDGSDGANEHKKQNDEPETKVIDPCNVYLTHPYGYEDDGMDFGPFGGSPFSSLFDDLFGDPISDLLGGLFGFDVTGGRSSAARNEPQKKPKKQGPIVEVKNVEILDENNNPIKEDKKQSEHHTTQTKTKHPFRRGNRKR